MQYLPFGPPVSWQMGSVGAYSRTIDTAGRMTAYTFEAGQRTLTWDASNRVTGITNPGGAQWTYGYDNLDRLVSATEGTQGQRAFTWDATGNRASTTINGAAYAYGVDAASNRLTTSTAPATAASYSYDAAGQMLSDGTRTFSWAAAGYLASATSLQGTASYSYNGFGQRVKKVIGTGVLASARHYLYAEDGVSLLGEYFQADAGAQVGTLNEVVYLEGIPVLVLAGGQTYFIQSDHLNTPRTIKNAAGAVVWRWESDAFGIGAANQNPGGVMLFEFNLRLPGQQFDAETGLYYNNARYYDQVTGRYISSDPIGLAGGVNTYSYVTGNPVSKVDQRGLWSVDVGGYWGPGMNFSVGYDANVQRGFFSMQFGYGVGGGFMVSPDGGLPSGQSTLVGCNGDQTFIEVFGKSSVSGLGANVDVVTVNAGSGLASGRPYSGLSWFDFSFGKKWGVKAEVAGGIQVTAITRPNSSEKCSCK